MTSTHGIIEVATERSNIELFQALKEYDGIESVSEEEGKIFLKLNKDISASELNEFLAKKDILLSHLVKRQPTLEQQFLSLTNNN